MKIYLKHHPSHAGKWIYEGYRRAWRAMGYDVVYFTNLKEISDSDDYYIMATDHDLKDVDSCTAIANSTKSFVFAQPNTFPDPWGRHPNFISGTPSTIIELINKLDNTILWTFSDDTRYHVRWKEVNTVPLAFDSIGYRPEPDTKFSQFDVCFVGGWANNGFDEKRKIMIEIFSKFSSSGLKCGFFVNKGLTHKQECDLIHNSRTALNIHDAYQRQLGYDTNERTFKSLGLNGALVSDTVAQLSNMFPSVPTSLQSADLVREVERFLSMTESEILLIKNQNRQNVLQNHTYINRVEQLLSL